MTDRARKTQRIEDALFGSVSGGMPEHLRSRCLRAFAGGRSRTIEDQRGMTRAIKALRDGPMPERDTEAWGAWWERYYSRSDVENAQKLARKRIENYKQYRDEQAA